MINGVIFSSKRTDDDNGYPEMATRLQELAEQQEGFIVRDTTRYVGTLCYKDRPNVMNSPEVQKLFYGRVNQG